MILVVRCRPLIWQAIMGVRVCDERTEFGCHIFPDEFGPVSLCWAEGAVCHYSSFLFSSWFVSSLFSAPFRPIFLLGLCLFNECCLRGLCLRLGLWCTQACAGAPLFSVSVCSCHPGVSALIWVNNRQSLLSLGPVSHPPVSQSVYLEFPHWRLLFDVWWALPE